MKDKFSRFKSWKWWLVFVFIAIPTLILAMPTIILSSVMPVLSDKSEDLNDWWLDILNKPTSPIFKWARKHYESYEQTKAD